MTDRIIPTEHPAAIIRRERAETHYEFTTRVQPPRPCAAWHLTFGGRCLNCGYEPA